jgi:hypothetical protein
VNKKLLFAAYGAWGLVAVCTLSYRTSEAKLDAQGILHEPFGFIPLAWFFGFLGFGLLVLARLFRAQKNRS